MQQIHARRGDIRTTKLVESDPPPLKDGDARLHIDLFGLTSNNITYAAMGDGQLGYWDFFPAPEGWGRPPVWGFGTVVQSKAPGVREGTRVYGYFPLGDTLDVTPTRATENGFVDGAVHRAPKAPIYNAYTSTAADPAYDAAYENEQVLLRPVYGAGWWLADFVHQGKPKSVISSSASSKSALAMADQLKRLGGATLIGLTSARNAAYVRDTGFYDRVLTYDDIGALNAEAPAAYVDFMGNGAIRAAVHRTLGKTLTRSVLFGATDWTAGGVTAPAETSPGPAPEFFFTPTHAMTRLKEDPSLAAASQRDLHAFYAASRAFVTPRHVTGAANILAAWKTLANGDTPPSDGMVCAF